jgi:two-component system chemotaxis response regulator CheB
MIKVLVVDDSATFREFLKRTLNSDPEIMVTATACGGEESIAAVKRNPPDVVTMDINMPGMNGFEATRRIMELRPVPIVIVRGNRNTKVSETVSQALEAGALTVVTRPTGVRHLDHKPTVDEFIKTVKTVSKLKLRHRPPKINLPVRTDSTASLFQPEIVINPKVEVTLVAIGASTGGPVVIRDILSELPRDFAVPILIVQHMSAGSAASFAEWLSHSTGMPVRLARPHERPRAGHVYIAPDSHHLGIDSEGYIKLSTNPPENGIRPSVAHLFRSAAINLGPKAIGVLLTGMGSDGSEELKYMQSSGAVTIAQDKESSAVHGMPGVAVNMNAANYVLPASKIPALLVSLVNLTRKK